MRRNTGQSTENTNSEIIEEQKAAEHSDSKIIPKIPKINVPDYKISGA